MLPFSAARAQRNQAKLISPVRLELSMEITTTTEDGYPSALRATVKNVGDVDADMPMPVFGCLTQGGQILLHIEWHSDDPHKTNGYGWGGGCGEGDRPSLTQQIRNEGVRLRPGEFITSSVNIHSRLQGIEPGIIEYWIEFIPPKTTRRDLVELQQAGYIVPTETIETDHQRFIVR